VFDTLQSKKRCRGWARLSAFMMAIQLSTIPEGLAMDIKGYGTDPSGLLPRYPRDAVCPALRSLHGAVAGEEETTKNQRQQGVVGGRFGDAIIAPADGKIIALWETDTGRGSEWAVLMSHASRDLRMSEAGISYLSEFSHLEPWDIQELKLGSRIRRGEKFGVVRYPGGNKDHPAGVWWRVFEAPARAERNLSWVRNRHGGDTWTHDAVRSIDPLFMLSRNQRRDTAGPVDLVPFTRGNDYSDFVGFTYIFECKGPPINE